MKPEFKYTLDATQIEEYIKLPSDQKLQWLEDILIFTEAALTPETRLVHDYFRDENGSISNAQKHA